MESFLVVIEHVARRVPMRLPALSASGFWMTNWSPGVRWVCLVSLGGASTMWNDEPLSTSLKVRVVSACAAVADAANAATETDATSARLDNMGPPVWIGGCG